MAKLFVRVKDLGYEISLTEAAKDYVANKGYDEKFGARPLKRAIQRYLEDPIAEEIINSKIEEGDTIKVDYKEKEDKIIVKISKPRAKKAKSSKDDPAE